MGEFFKINGVVYADCDKSCVITPLEGKNANKPFTISTATSIDYTNDGDSEGIGQTGSPAKSGLAVTEAEAEWELEISMGERMELTQHLGPGGARVRCSWKLIWQRKGLKTMVVETGDGSGKPGGYTYITKGLMGAKTSSGGKPETSIGGKVTDIMENGISIWTKPPE